AAIEWVVYVEWRLQIKSRSRPAGGLHSAGQIVSRVESESAGWKRRRPESTFPRRQTGQEVLRIIRQKIFARFRVVDTGKADLKFPDLLRLRSCVSDVAWLLAVHCLAIRHPCSWGSTSDPLRMGGVGLADLKWSVLWVAQCCR